MHKKHPGFAGFIRYETTVELPNAERVMLELSDAFEGVEAFANDESAGIQRYLSYKPD